MALQTAEKRATVPLDAAVRTDTWWLKPLFTVVGLSIFVMYATWRMFENDFYNAEKMLNPLPYLSPFYSPLIPLNLEIAGWAVSPAMYVLVFPLSFRMTCYYYRQAYYRSFFLDPAGCAVPEPSLRKKYNGERSFPFVLQNLHRYTLYAAIGFLGFLAYDAGKAFFFHGQFGVGVGSLVLLANILLLCGYTFGCHSFRHIMGGRLDCFTCPMGNDHAKAKVKTGYHAWKIVTIFNVNHMQWAWCSLFGVILTDLYIRSVIVGIIPDYRFF